MNIINSIAVLFYLSATIIVVRSLFQQQNKPPAILYWIAAAALGCHAISMLPQLVAAKGYYLTISDIGSLLWLIISLVLTLTAYRTENLLLLLLAFCISAATVAWNGFTQPDAAPTGSLSPFLITLLASHYSLLVVPC